MSRSGPGPGGSVAVSMPGAAPSCAYAIPGMAAHVLASAAAPSALRQAKRQGAARKRRSIACGGVCGPGRMACLLHRPLL